jgi:hypothetical protein
MDRRRRTFLWGAGAWAAGAALAGPAWRARAEAADKPTVTVHKSPT